MQWIRIACSATLLPCQAWWKLTISVRSSLLDDKQEWSTRERALLGELVAVRAQVDKLLDQQQMLISLLAASAMPGGGAAAAAAAQAGLQSRGAQLDVAM